MNQNEWNDDLTIKLSHMCCSSAQPDTPSTGTRSQGWRSRKQVVGQKGDMLSDLYSLGFIFHFCMLRGKHSFKQLDGNGAMTNVDRCEQKIFIDKRVLILITELSYRFSSVVTHILSASPEIRYTIF
jgi:serine/threonine protein kinase